MRVKQMNNDLSAPIRMPTALERFLVREILGVPVAIIACGFGALLLGGTVVLISGH